MQQNRERWIDTTRGTMMLLVVFVHSMGFVATAGHHVPAWVEGVNQATDAFRMTVLIALAGSLATRALRKDSRTFFASKVHAVVWPYAIWATLTMVAILGYQGPGSVARAVLLPGPYLWFSWALMGGFAVAWALRAHRHLALPVAAAAVVGSAFIPLPETSWAVFNVGFFLLGWWLTDNRDAIRGPLRTVLVIVGAAATVVVAVVDLSGITTRHQAIWAWGPVGLLLVVMLTAPGWRIPRLAAPVEWVGRNSMVFYSTHALVAFLVNRAAARLGEPSLLASAPLLTGCATFLIALAVCITVTHLRRIPLIDLAFAWPKRRAAHRRAPLAAS